MRQRIAQLKAEKTKLLNHMDAASDAVADGLNQYLVAVNKDLATAHERLAHYEAQLGKKN